MSGENNDKVTQTKEVSIVPGEWAAKKVLGPLFDEIGLDLSKLYKKGVKKIGVAAQRKIKDINDNKSANLRVARDVFQNGSFTESDIAAEYFAGVLASSRSIEGKDDSMIYYSDIVKGLSSSQLKLHYLVYRAITELALKDEKKKMVNTAMSTELVQLEIYFFGREVERFGINIDTDFVALHNKGLIDRYGRDNEKVLLAGGESNKSYSECVVSPTTLGFQLYSVCHGEISEWRQLLRSPREAIPTAGALRSAVFKKSELHDLAKKEAEAMDA